MGGAAKSMKQEIEQLVERMVSQGILLDEAVTEFEKAFILKILNQHQNNLCKAATALGIHRNTLSKRLAEYQSKSEKSGLNSLNGAAKKSRQLKTSRPKSPSARRI